MRKYRFLFFLGTALYATEPSSFQMDLGTGYRQDFVNYRFKRVGVNYPFKVYHVDANPLRGIATFGFAQAILRGFVLRGDGDYTALLSGKTDLTYYISDNEGSTSSSAAPVFQTAGNSGYIFDLAGSGGYRFCLFDAPSMTFEITPRAGYGIFHYHLHMKEEAPQPSFADMSKSSLADTTISLRQDAATAKLHWFGPLIGADFSFRFLSHYLLTATYVFHWLHLKFQQTPSFDMSVTNEMGTVGILDTKKYRFKVEDGWSHQVQGRFSYLIGSRWSVGLMGQCQLFGIKKTKVKILDTSTDQQTGITARGHQPNLFKTEARMFLLGAEASYTF